MSISLKRFASERDLVARYILPKLEEASKVLGYSDAIDLYVEKSINGTPDLSLYRGGKELFLIEAKFKKKSGSVEFDIEPRDPEVIQQAVNYAVNGGFTYYATCNARRLILFQLRAGKKPHESEIVTFEYDKNPKWAEEVLKYVLGLVEVKLKAVDETLVDLLHETFEDLYPEFFDALKEKLSDSKFKKKYIEWLESQGIEFNDQTNRLIASQTTYLQLNKLLFYQVIRVIYPDRLARLEIKEDEDVSEALTKFYNQAKKIDYAPIYESDLISEIPFTVRAKERLRTLLDTLNEFDFSTIESDFIGRVYEKLIPPQERKNLGQFYTPPRVVDFITNLVLRNQDDVILDPACGSGTFLVRAYHRLRELNGVPRNVEGGLGETFHKQLLERIYGIDINQFPAHLSVINLAIQNSKAKIDKMNVIVNDFFNIKSGHATLLGFQSMDTEGKPTEVELPAYFDVIVANPPYIRQELLGEDEKKKIVNLVQTEFKNKLFVGRSRKQKGAIALDKQSDIYIYFFIHAIGLLKNGGRLGFISSNKWLEVAYGESFQEFLLNFTKIRYIVEFDRAVFPDLEVDTAVTILEKESNPDIRKNNSVKFVRVKHALPMHKLIDVLGAKERSLENDDLRIIVSKQGQLKAGKWNTYLRAPPVLFKIMNHEMMKPLGEIAEVIRGYTTGYDPFFILSEEKVKEWNIEKEFLEPCAPAGERIKGLSLKKKDITEYFFIVNKSKSELIRTNALKYIQFGEKLEVEPKARRKVRVLLPEVETIKNRRNWYSLPVMKKPSIIFPMWFRYKYRVFLNEANAYGHAFYYHIKVKDKQEKCITALLNSTLTQLILEVLGRQYSGMLHMKVYELKLLPVIDPNSLTQKQIDKLTLLFDQLNEAVTLRMEKQEEYQSVKSKHPKEEGLFESEAKRVLEQAIDNERKIRKEIDNMIYHILDLDKEDIAQIEVGLRHLRELRKTRTRGKFAK